MLVSELFSLFQDEGQGRDEERDNIDTVFGVKGKGRDTE